MFVCLLVILPYLLVSPVDQTLGTTSNIVPCCLAPNEELLDRVEASFLEVTPTFSAITIDFVYRREGDAEKIGENQGGGYFFAYDF